MAHSKSPTYHEDGIGDLEDIGYHIRLRCFVVVDLKMEAFKPKFSGKLNFALSSVDDQLRHGADPCRKSLPSKFALSN